MSPHRIRIATVAAAAAALLVPAAVAVAGPSSVPEAKPAAARAPGAAGVLWTGDPARGTGVFQSLERAPGTIGVADDPKGQYGRVFKYETWDHDRKERCESKGQKLPNGQPLTFSRAGDVFYVGWRSLWNPMPTPSGRWVALWQIHHYGAGPGGGPLALRTLGDGRLHLQYTAGNGRDRHVWSTALPKDKWVSFAVGFRLSKSESDGWLEFYYNGEQQKLEGKDRLPAALLGKPNTDYVTNKWGVYRSGPVSGRATAYLQGAKVGTTYADVALS